MSVKNPPKHTETQLSSIARGKLNSEYGIAGPVNPSVVHASTMAMHSLADLESVPDVYHQTGRGVYGIYGSSLHRSFEEMISELEGGYDSLIVESGLAAVTLVLQTFCSKPIAH